MGVARHDGLLHRAHLDQHPAGIVFVAAVHDSDDVDSRPLREEGLSRSLLLQCKGRLKRVALFDSRCQSQLCVREIARSVGTRNSPSSALAMSKGTIAILVAADYEDLEVWYPKLRLEEAGYETPLIGLGERTYSGKWGYPAVMDRHVADVDPATLCGVLAPGGWAPDKLRRDPAVLNLVRHVDHAGGLVATICHGPWILISAGVVRGKRMTSTVGIRDDVVNAGALWVNEPTVIDGHLVSARVPQDLPAFARAMLHVLDEQARRHA